MMTLISLAIVVAYVYSSLIVIGLTDVDFFWELATLIVIIARSLARNEVYFRCI